MNRTNWFTFLATPTLPEHTIVWKYQMGNGCGGVIPKFSRCSDGVRWFESKGRFRDGSYTPVAGDIIFFDWGDNGTIDHVGIVESVSGGTVNTIEGLYHLWLKPHFYFFVPFIFSSQILILEGVTNREYYGRSATTIENKCKIEYGTEQGLAALIYGEKGLSSLPIQDIAGEHIDTDNEYMYYYSVEFIK